MATLQIRAGGPKVKGKATSVALDRRPDPAPSGTARGRLRYIPNVDPKTGPQDPVEVAHEDVRHLMAPAVTPDVGSVAPAKPAEPAPGPIAKRRK